MAGQLLIKEELNPGLKAGLFGNFTNVNEALLEIIDNSVAQRIEGQTMLIKILFIPNSKKIEISDSGGKGMDWEQLNSFWQWGLQKKRTTSDIGLYSQGGKAAIGYLGKAFSLVTSSNNSEVSYAVDDLNYHDTSSLKEYKVKKQSVAKKEGFTHISIEKVEKSTFTNSVEEKIKTKLSETYRPLIEKGLIELYFNTDKLGAIEYPLDDKLEIEKFHFDITDHKKTTQASGWIGRLLPRKESKGKVCNGGVRVYYRGRLILGNEYFGNRDAKYKASLNYLIGELNVDSVVQPNMNKTSFNKSTDSWRELEEKMAQILDPHINDLLDKATDDISDEEIESAERTRRLLEEAIKLASRDMKLDITSNGGIGIKRKNPALEKNNQDAPKRQISRTSPNPKTPPPPESIGNRKRLSNLPEWKLESIGENIRSYIKEDVLGNTKKKTLIINTNYSGYQRFLKTPQRRLYLLETSAIQMAQMDTDTTNTKDFLEKFDSLFATICDYVDEASDNLKKKDLSRSRA